MHINHSQIDLVIYLWTSLSLTTRHGDPNIARISSWVVFPTRISETWETGKSRPTVAQLAVNSSNIAARTNKLASNRTRSPCENNKRKKLLFIALLLLPLQTSTVWLIRPADFRRYHFQALHFSSTNLEKMEQCSFSSLPQSTLCLSLLLLGHCSFETLLRAYASPAAEGQGGPEAGLP